MLKEIINELKHKRDLQKIKEMFELEYEGTIEPFNEATFNRVLQHLKGKRFAIITASRGKYSRKENHKRNNELLKRLRDYNLGAIRLVGHWKECSVPLKKGEKITDCKGKIIDQLEESFIIPLPNDIDIEEFKKFLIEMAKKYEQDAFILADGDKIYLYSKEGKIWDVWNEVTDKNIYQGFEKILGLQGFSQFAKDRATGRVRGFYFENLFINVPKDSVMSKMLFSKQNILF